MALVKCPECGREGVSNRAKACPGCGFQISEYYQNNGYSNLGQRNLVKYNLNKRNISLNRKWMIPIGLIVLVSIIYYSSTRCAKDDCYRTKMSSGRYCSYHQTVIDNFSSYSSYYDNYSNKTYKSISNLKITDVYVHTNSTTTYCTGKITNYGNDTFKFVQVKGAFKDRNGNVIETGNSYAVGSEGLSAGESTSFSIYCDHNSYAVDCDVNIYDYD